MKSKKFILAIAIFGGILVTLQAATVFSQVENDTEQAAAFPKKWKKDLKKIAWG